MLLKNLITKQVNNIIKENMKLITEKWSISDVVDINTDKLLNYIKHDYTTAKIVRVTDGVFFISKENENNFTINDKTFNLNYYIYNCANNAICDIIHDEGEYINGFQEEENVLNLTLYMVKNQWRLDYCQTNVSHELEHILQISYGYSKNPNYKKLMYNAYKYANQVLRNKNDHSSIDRKLAWIVYYSNSHEQDAFMQEYAMELKNNPSKIVTKNAEIYKILINYDSYCKWFLDNYNSKNVKSSLNEYIIFGYNLSNFKLMSTKQLSRFKRKMNYGI